ncbi:MAG: hypothetical protein IIA88_08895, partial [Bacteroidetes bacterium]|nr:hypothetical protein [Bacteroidota bacterium]
GKGDGKVPPRGDLGGAASIKINLAMGFAVKEIYPTGGRKYFAAIVSAYAARNISAINKLCVGIDGFYDSSLKQEIIKDSLNLNGATPDIKRAGMIIGHELMVGKLSMITHFGAYFYRPYKKHRPFYQRYGFKYQFSKTFFGGIYLKVHLGSADYIEWSFGIQI